MKGSRRRMPVVALIIGAVTAYFCSVLGGPIVNAHRSHKQIDEEPHQTDLPVADMVATFCRDGELFIILLDEDWLKAYPLMMNGRPIGCRLDATQHVPDTGFWGA